MYVYVKGDSGLWKVGFFTPKGDWYTETIYKEKERAAYRVHYLNGGSL
jgi:hypothetical protein